MHWDKRFVAFNLNDVAVVGCDAGACALRFLGLSVSFPTLFFKKISHCDWVGAYHSHGLV